MFMTRTRNNFPRNTFGSPFELINRFIGEARDSVSSTFPTFNVWANEEGAVVTSELPGVRLEDLDIVASGKTISIKGARKEGSDEEGVRYLRRERPEGEFNRSIELPFQIDSAKVSASLSKGVLEITLPRAESDKPRKITVTAE